MDLLASIDFAPLWKYRVPLMWGLVTTLWIAVTAFAIAVPAGLLLALGRLRGGVVLNVAIMAFVDLMRFTPLLVQAVWIHFALPAITGVSMSATQSGLLALTLHVSAYVCDIMRAGIVAVPPTQREAGRALGLRPRIIFLKIVLPQVWPLVLPPLANVAVATFKLTAILGILAINDLMKVANRINNIIFRPVEVYTSAALVYLAVGLVLMALAAWVERRYGSEAVRLRQGRGAPTGGIARAA